MEIVFSPKIAENDVLTLTEIIAAHMELIQRIFQCKLTPKHHLLTHYPLVIRKMGPTVHTSMIRHEAKHREFTKFIDTKGNYKNLLKSLAYEHQDRVSRFENCVANTVLPGKKVNILNCKNESVILHRTLSAASFEKNDEIFLLKHLKINDYLYKPDIFICSERKFLRIKLVLAYGDPDQYFFIAKECKLIAKNEILNSVEIEETECSLLVKLTDLYNPRSYEARQLESKMYIICDTLDVASLVNVV